MPLTDSKVHADDEEAEALLAEAEAEREAASAAGEPDRSDGARAGAEEDAAT